MQLQIGTNRNITEQFCHIIWRNGTGSNAHTTAKYTSTCTCWIAVKLPSVVVAFPVSKGSYILAEV